MVVTIKDVAKRAGVSTATVSRVMHGYANASKHTICKVQSAIKELGYQPNMVAKSLVLQATRSIGIVLPKPAEELFADLFFMELIRGIVTRAGQSGYDVFIRSGADEKEELEATFSLVKSGRVDGVIVLCSRKDDPVVEFLNSEGYPFVLVGRSNKDDGTLSVDTDNVSAAYEATSHLISMGHQRIGFICGPPNMIVSLDRLKGYRKALEDFGLEFRSDWIMEESLLKSSSYRALSIFMNLSVRPTALVVVDDMVSFGVLRGLRELNYNVPDDMVIVSFNNIPLAALSNPPISSIDIDIYLLGFSSAHLLIRKISHFDKEGNQSTHLIIPHRLVVRESSMKSMF